MASCSFNNFLFLCLIRLFSVFISSILFLSSSTTFSNGISRLSNPPNALLRILLSGLFVISFSKSAMLFCNSLIVGGIC